jgi:hypothetical protein
MEMVNLEGTYLQKIYGSVSVTLDQIAKEAGRVIFFLKIYSVGNRRNIIWLSSKEKRIININQTDTGLGYKEEGI